MNEEILSEDVISEEEPEQIEETTEEVVEETEEEVEEEAQAEETEPEAEPEKPSRRESLRIQKLLSELKNRSPEPKSTVNGLDYNTALDADQEVISQLEADRRGYGDKRYNEGLQQVESIQFHTRLELDAPKVENKYPQLNPNDKEHFNPATADAVNNLYINAVGYDPNTRLAQNGNIRYADFVDGIMELADEIAGDKTTKATKNIAKQAAKTSIRPDGSTSKRLDLNKAPQAMTDEELEAVIARSIPSRR